MTFNPNDPKWTAYVAGELDAAERAGVEQELKQSSEARALVAEIEKVIGALVVQLKAEPVPAAPASMAVEQASAVRLPKGRLLYISGVASAAAAAAIIGVSLFTGNNDANQRREVVHNGPLPMASSTAPKAARADVESFSYRDARNETDRLDSNGEIADGTRNSGGKNSGKPVSGEFGKKRENAEAKELPFSDEDYRSPASRRTSSVSMSSGEKRPQFPANPSGDVNRGERGYNYEFPPPNTAKPTDGPAPVPQLRIAPAPVDDFSDFAPVTKARPVRPSVSNRPSDPAQPAIPSAARPATPVVTDRLKEHAPVANGRPSSLAPHASTSALNTPAPAEAGRPAPADVAAAAPAAAAPAAESFLDAIDAQQKVLDKILVDKSGLSSDLEREAEGRRFAAGEAYEQVADNAFMPALENPLSTFSIDVDTASYSNIRRFITQNHMLPPPAAVRIEEMVNYFRYEYPQPEGETPFQANIEVASCPWNQDHRLVRVGIKGREIAANKRPPSNLVFLVDVSGSMAPSNKLPLVREGLKMLTRQLTENDRIAIVVYAGSSGLVLPSTTGDKQQTILDALDRLEAGGSTNGAQGIQLAYEVALQNFLKGCTNRVILATDGDFNVGVTDRGQLISLIEQQAKTGVFLTTLGFGMGNIKDATLEQLADKGNGAYAYVDDIREAKKVLVDEMSGTLVTIAKDVKIQIEFNPAEVGSYRLIGYENRIMKHEDFNNDQKDAGEIGAGHTVTALYEVVPAGQAADVRPAVDPLKYQPKPEAKKAAVAGEHPGELLTLKLRYKQPDGDVSKLLEYPVKDGGKRWAQATGDFKFAASVALFGMILRNSPHKGASTIDAVIELAGEGRGSDESGYRQEFISLVQAAKNLGK